MSESATPTAKQAWLEERRKGIGGSDAAAVLGLSRWKTPLQVYVEKLGIADDAEETEAMRMGTILEPIVAQLYQDETKRELRHPGPFTIRRSAANPFMTATLDREILGDPRGLGVLQIKTASFYKAEEWADEPPVMYQVQLQHEIAVADAAWGSLAVLIGGQKFLWMDLERNDRFIWVMIEREAEFWRRVQAQDPPDPAATKTDRELLATLYPKDSGEVVALPGEASAWDAQRLEAIDELKKWDAIKDAAENRIKAALGEASAGILPDGVQYTWTTSKRSAYSVAESSVRTLRRKKP